MPIIKSAIKRNRQATKRRSHNLVVKALVKKDIRSLMDAIEAKDAKAIVSALSEAASELDRAVKKGTLHKNTANRKKSRLAKLANQAVATGEVKKAPAAGKKATTAPKATTKKAVAKKAPAKKPAAK